MRYGITCSMGLHGQHQKGGETGCGSMCVGGGRRHAGSKARHRKLAD
jgi:hypothetical protein